MKCLTRQPSGVVWHVPEAPGTPGASATGAGDREGLIANLGKKGDVYVARFRYDGKEYKKSLRTTCLAGQGHKAPSSVYSEGIHLRNLVRLLGARADAPAARLTRRDLEQFLQARLKVRSPGTVRKERDTVSQFFRWVVAHDDLTASPADGLTRVKGEVDLPPFRTIAEIEGVLARGGLSESEALELSGTACT